VGGVLVALATAGVLLTAIGRGLVLRVQFEGRKADGSADSAISNDLLARLYTLGCERPRGLEVPEGTDVSALPAEALTSLPEGAIAKAFFQTLQALTVAVPWRVVATADGSDALAVTVRRNGRVVESALIRHRDFDVPKPNGGKCQPTTGGLEAVESKQESESHPALLVAAAALVLMNLASRHPSLEAGLAGTTRWRSLALQVIATDQSFTGSQPDRIGLLGDALDEDPGNATARIALVYAQWREESEADELLAIARQLENEVDRLPGTALQMRVLFNVTVAYTNHYLMVQETSNVSFLSQTQTSWLKAREYANRLICLLAQKFDKDLQEFADDLRPSAAFLHAGIIRRTDCASVLDNKLLRTAKPWQVMPLSPSARYARACLHTTYPTTYTNALDDLEFACACDDIRKWARRDPFFNELRESAKETHRQRYRRIVGDPLPAEFLELPPMNEYAKPLNSLGIHSADDLLSTNSWLLARNLGTPRAKIRHWQDIARVARTQMTPGGNALSTEIVSLLIAAGIDTPVRLRSALDDRELLRNKLLKAAADKAVDPPTEKMLRAWRLLD
jgi:hypothetical protein